jgi:hypothetical protein
MNQNAKKYFLAAGTGAFLYGAYKRYLGDNTMDTVNRINRG